MNAWRYANLMEPYEEIGIFAGAVERDLEGSQEDQSDHTTLKKSDDGELYNGLYAYGYPLDLVYHALKKGAEYRLARIRGYIKRGSTEEGDHLQLVLGIASLIQEEQIVEQTLDVLSGVEKAMHEENCDGWSLRLTRKFARRELDEEAARLARNILDYQAQVHATDPKKAFPDEPAYCYIALRDAGAFNTDVRRYMEDGYLGSPASRKRKRNAVPNFLVDLTLCSSRAALALDFGVPLTFVDPALPIWDFPIAQRPEIQALLPEEARKKIPKL